MPLLISDELRKKLTTRRADQIRRLREGLKDDRYGGFRFDLEILLNVDGVRIYGTIGADLFLTFDGRIILAQDRQPIRETRNLGMIALGLSNYALFHDMPELLELLPQRPEDQSVCHVCGGSRISEQPNWTPRVQVCHLCWGLGWGEPNPDTNE